MTRREMRNDEEILFKSDEVVVTDKRVLLKSKSYTVSAIASVRVRKREAEFGKKKRFNPARVYGILFGLAAGIAGIALGVLSFLVAYNTPVIMVVLLVFALLTFGFGVLIIVSSRKIEQAPTQRIVDYAVVIRTIDGQEEKIRQLTKEQAKAIADAISAATASRG